MTASELTFSTLSNLPYAPNDPQLGLIMSLSTFVISHGPRDVFILNGYAGTGKTSITGAFVKSLKEQKIKTILLAPTGRAAKVAANFSSSTAFTIHKHIFRGNCLDPSSDSFFLAENKNKDTIFIVDEASLITDSDYFQHSLLQQLVRYVYSGVNCTMILIGDLAQLPPIGQQKSLAMNPERLKVLGLNTISHSLKKPVRQAIGSGILYNATIIRKFLSSKIDSSKFFIYESKFPDVTIVEGGDLADVLHSSWNKVGREETLIVTRSNKRANDYNRAIRNLVMYAEQPLEQGDRIVISKNDYYWSKINKLENFIANGETAEIKWVGKAEKKYGRWFADVEIQLQDSVSPIAAKIMLRSLMAEGPSIPREEMERFYNYVMAEQEGELTEKIRKTMRDPYYNALQVKYAYCITCHKAQGGQWKHVYIDMGNIDISSIESDFYRWLYTAITRATEHIFLINPTVRIK